MSDWGDESGGRGGRKDEFDNEGHGGRRFYGDRRRSGGSEDDELSRKRRRRESGGSGSEKDEIGEKLSELISRVGEKSNSSLESNLESLAQVLETDLDTYAGKIIEILVLCISSMPDKLTIYSTLVGLLNAKKYNFGGDLLGRLLMVLDEKMQQNDFDRALYIILFLSDLVNCRVITLSTYTEFLEAIVEAGCENNVPQVRTDWFMYVALHCLPWIGQELAEKKAERLNAMLEKIGQYLKTRKMDYVKMLQVWSNSIHEQEEYLTCLWSQISKLRSDGWKEKVITRHYVAFDGTLADALQHNLPSFSPPFHTPESRYPLPSVVFRCFDYADCPEGGPVLPGVHSIERFLVEEEIRWILEQDNTSRKQCCSARVTIQKSVRHIKTWKEVIATHLLEYDKRTLIPINYVILEVIFSQLFRLPEAPLRPIFYGSLLIELCKTKSMPQVIAQAAELFYQRIDSMQVSCIDRLIDWFSYHMSNFEYRWSWADWNDCLKMDKLAPRYIFVREMLEKCMRLSYYQRLKDFLPHCFEKAIPDEPKIIYTLDDEDHPDHEFAMALEKAFREKKPAAEMTELVLLKTEDKVDTTYALSVFLKVLLNLARKTFSHNFAALTRYYETFKKLIGSSEEAQLTVLRNLYEVWKNHQQMLTVLITKLLKMSLLDAGSVVVWIFSDEMRSEFGRLWTWEVLTTALDNVSGQVRRIRISIDNARNNEGDGANDSFSNYGMEDGRDENDERRELYPEEPLIKESEYSELQACLKNLLLSVLHKYTVILTEHIVNCETNGTDFRNLWCSYVMGRFRNVFQKYWKELFKFTEDLDRELFKASAIDPNILEIYNQFRALRE